MLKRMLVVGLTVALAAAVLISCGGSSTPTPNPSQGALITFIGDAPLCDVVSFYTTISGLTVTPVGGGPEVGVIVSSASFAPSIKANLTTLRDFPTILYMNNVTEGSYDQATLSLSETLLAAYDPTLNPPVKTINAALQPAKPTFTIGPPLTITKGKVSVFRLDFDMLRSVEVDSQGQVTGKVTPVIRATTLTPTASGGFGELNDLAGFVRSVSTTGSSANFIGSFLTQLLSGSLSGAPAVNVNVMPDCQTRPTNCTQLFGTPSLNQLLTDSYVEVDAYLDTDGSVIAKTVEVEYQENPDENKIALIGPITSLTKDGTGNLAQFNLWVHEEEPDASTQVPLDSIVTVSVSSSTTYAATFQSAVPSPNFASLTFDSSALAVGQAVVVHGQYTKTTGLPTTVAADKVYLKLQTMQGNFASLVQAGSDDKTGVFQLAPCCTLLKGAPIYVVTNNQTLFVNVNGLSALTAQPTLLIKGLPFYEPHATTINGVALPAGALVVLAKQVHQL